MTHRVLAAFKTVRSSVLALSALSVTTALTALLAFLSQLFFARALGPSDYGALATVLATLSLLSPLAGFGIGKYWLRAFGLEGWQAQRWLAPSLRFASLTTLVTMLLVLLWVALGAINPIVQRLALILLPTLLIYPLSELVYARFQLEGRYGQLSLWQMGPNFMRFIVAASAFVLGLGLVQIAWGLTLLLGLLSLGLTVMIGRMLHGKLRLHGHGQPSASLKGEKVELGAVFKASWPFALAGIFYLIYFQSDILLLGWMRNTAAAGVYNTAFAVMAAVYLLPGIVYQKFLLPKLHRWAEHDHQRFLGVYRFGNAASLLLGVIVAAMLFLIAPWLMPFLFGEAYRAAGQLLLVLAFAVPAHYLATSVGAVLVTQDNMRRKVWLMGLSALVNLLLNLLLIPRFGIYGAAWATVASETVLAMAYLYAAGKYIFGVSAWQGWTLNLATISAKDAD
jgi:O-antigen/teichoic acid export membrane protein